MRKRILSILLTLCLAFTLLPVTALAIEEPSLHVGGVLVTSENAGCITGPGITGTVSYDADSSILTLNSASVTGAYTDDCGYKFGIYAYDINLTIVLVGSNTIIGAYSSEGSSYGVYVADGRSVDSGNVTINGSGSLNAVGGAAGRRSYGVYGSRSVTINGAANVTATGGEAAGEYGGSYGVYSESIVISGSANVTAMGGEATGENGVSSGVYGDSGSISVTGGTVTATGGAATGEYGSSYGVYCYNVYGHSGSISVTGGVVNATGGAAGSASYGVFVGTINVNSESGSGLLIAKGGSATASNAANTVPTCGIGSAALAGVTEGTIGKFAVWGVTGTYTVLDSALDLSSNTTTSGWSDSTNSRGWKWEYNAEGTSTLTLKNVIINAPDAGSGSAYGIELPDSAVNIALEGVNVVSAGGSSSGDSCGVYCGGSVAISGTDGGALYALAGTAAGDSCGVFSDGIDSSTITISGSITATGGAASDGDSCGVYSDCDSGSSSVTISGTVTATGGKGTSSYGVYSECDTTDSSTITLSGTVTATSGTAAGDSCGVFSDGIDSSTITISGSVTATGGAASHSENESCGVFSNGDTSSSISVTGGSVTATGGGANGDGSGSFGVFSNSNSDTSNISVTGGSVTATGGTASGGGSGGLLSCSENESSSITLSGAVTAVGGTANESESVSFGVWSYSGNESESGSISVTGGTATAVSGTVGEDGSSQAMSTAPDYTAAIITASGNADGSSPAESYDDDHIENYKYLKIATLYVLTVNLNGGSGSTATGNSYMAGDAVSIDAGTKSGCTFSGWTATGGGTFAGTSSAATTYTMPASAATITANWTANSTGSGGNDDDTPSRTITVTETSSPLFNGAQGAVRAQANMENAFSTSVEVRVTDSDEAASEFGLGAGNTVYPFDISLYIKGTNTKTEPKDGYAVTISLPIPDDLLDVKEQLSVAHKAGDGSVTSLTSQLKQINGVWYLVFQATDFSLYALVVTGTGTYEETAGLPYYVSSDGNEVFIGFAANGKYIAPSGVTVLFKENAKTFTDIGSHWAKDCIGFITEREIFLGTGSDAFSPDSGMTRAMFATVIGRLYERSYGEIEAVSTHAFTDCDYDDYYGKYVDWAAKNGIFSGYGNDKFGPGDPVTREQMAAILYRFAEFLGVLPGNMDTALSYPDANSISDCAKNAALYCQTSGIITGYKGGSFFPQGTATRAEVVVILERLIKNILG